MNNVLTVQSFNWNIDPTPTRHSFVSLPCLCLHFNPQHRVEIKIETFARRENNDSAMDEDTSKNKAFVCAQQRRILKTRTESRDEVIVIIKNGKGITNFNKHYYFCIVGRTAATMKPRAEEFYADTNWNFRLNFKSSTLLCHDDLSSRFVSNFSMKHIRDDWRLLKLILPHLTPAPPDDWNLTFVRNVFRNVFSSETKIVFHFFPGGGKLLGGPGREKF